MPSVADAARRSPESSPWFTHATVGDRVWTYTQSASRAATHAAPRADRGMRRNVAEASAAGQTRAAAADEVRPARDSTGRRVAERATCTTRGVARCNTRRPGRDRVTDSL